MPARPLSIIVAALLLAACGSQGIKGDGPPRSGSGRIQDLPGDAVPRPEPRSRYGNGPVYEVLGKRYTVMPSSSGYSERGVASWYGKKFHGRPNSSRVTFDMYQMTAAHKTLPLPTYVHVRNLRNGRTVVVRVNDRGPFVHNRIIDLSYSAALKLDMIGEGTSPVEVTAISFDELAGDQPTRDVTPPEPEPRATPVPVAAIDTEATQIFVQVGAFGDRGNAETRANMLASSGFDKVFILEDFASSPALLRVRIGPVADIIQYDLLVEELENIGITDPYLIVE